MGAETTPNRRTGVRERPERVVCKICGKPLHLLHGPHLRTHGISSQDEYREMYNLGPSVPLNSQQLSETMSNRMQNPDNLALSTLMGKNSRLRKAVAQVLLEREDFYFPARAAQIIGVHRQTVYSAIQEGRLPTSSRPLLISREDGSVVIAIKQVRGVTLEDMLRFKAQHKPKRTSQFKDI